MLTEEPPSGRVAELRPERRACNAQLARLQKYHIERELATPRSRRSRWRTRRL